MQSVQAQAQMKAYRHSQTVWPLYLVVGNPTDSPCFLPVPTRDVVSVTASFAFARLLTDKLRRHTSTSLEILRVVYHNGCCAVTSQSSSDMTLLDTAWKRPPSVLTESYCLLCVKSWPDIAVQALEGVSVSSEAGSRCPRHNSEWAPQYLHERLKLNTLHRHWDKIETSGVHRALRSAKLAWIGLVYFSRSMQNVLPSEVINKIITAVICQY